MRNHVTICIVLVALALGTSAPAAVLDLTTPNAIGSANGAYFREYHTPFSTGTGTVEPFVRIQGGGTERGYNTDGAHEFETVGGSWTHSVTVGTIPTVTLGGTTYLEFLLDINEKTSDSLLSVDELKFFVETSPSLTGYPDCLLHQVWDLGDNWIQLDATLAGSGSGNGDMLAYVPASLFGADPGAYLYLYARMGAAQASDDGFEEWAYGVGGPITPEPATLCLLALGAAAIRSRRRPPHAA